jgi:hypothetical protein
MFKSLTDSGIAARGIDAAAAAAAAAADSPISLPTPPSTPPSSPATDGASRATGKAVSSSLGTSSRAAAASTAAADLDALRRRGRQVPPHMPALHFNLLVVGGPGLGKSTLIANLAEYFGGGTAGGATQGRAGAEQSGEVCVR